MSDPNMQASRTSGKSWLDYAELVDLAQHNIVEAVYVVQRQAQQAADGVTESMYAEAAVALVYAYLLATDDHWWNNCCALTVWNGRLLDRSNALLIAFKVVLNAYDGLLYERARFHAKALREAFRIGIPAECLKDYIRRNHGFKQLHDAEIARERALEHYSTLIEEAGADASRGTDNSNGTMPDAPPPESDQREPAEALAKNARRPKQKKERRKLSDEAKYPAGTDGLIEVGVLVDPALFSGLMMMYEGRERMRLDVFRRANGDSEYVRLEAIEVDM